MATIFTASICSEYENHLMPDCNRALKFGRRIIAGGRIYTEYDQVL